MSRDIPVVFMSETDRRLKKDANVSTTLWFTIRMLIVCIHNTISHRVVYY